MNITNTVDALAQLRSAGARIESVNAERNRVFITLSSATDKLQADATAMAESRNGERSIAFFTTINNCTVYWRML